MRQKFVELLKFLKEDYKKLTDDMFSLQGEEMAKTVGRLSLLCVVRGYVEELLEEQTQNNPIGFTSKLRDSKGDVTNG